MALVNVHTVSVNEKKGTALVAVAQGAVTVNGRGKNRTVTTHEALSKTFHIKRVGQNWQARTGQRFVFDGSSFQLY